MAMGARLQNVFDWYSSGPPAANQTDHNVEVGDRFYKVGYPDLSWCVDRIFCPSDGYIPHAVIVRDGNFHAHSVVSLSALTDRSIFRPDQRNDAVAAGGMDQRQTEL